MHALNNCRTLLKSNHSVNERQYSCIIYYYYKVTAKEQTVKLLSITNSKLHNYKQHCGTRNKTEMKG